MKDISKVVGSNIKKFRELRNMTQEQLAEELNTTRQSISRYESGERKANQDILFELADILKVSVGDFFPKVDKRNIVEIYNRLTPPRQTKVYDFASRQLEEQESKVVPLVGATAANPQVADYADQINDISINTDVPNSADCALVVRGNSMEPDYMDGSIVFYKRQNSVENGELAIVEIDGDGVTFKKIIFDYDNQQLILRSLNPEYPDREIDGDRINIVGKVIN